MKSDLFRYYHPNLLIPLIVFFGILLYFGNKLSGAHLGVSVSIVSIISFLLVAIDRKLWKYKPFSFLFWSLDVSGHYEGEITYVDPTTKTVQSKKAIVKIFQTGSSIKVLSQFGDFDSENRTDSNSLQTSLVKDEHGICSIVFTYQNDGNHILGYPPHFGTNVLHVGESMNGAKVLDGVYYTDRTPNQTKGKIRVELVKDN